MSKLYPVGVQNFEKVILGSYEYVDKTALIYQLFNTGSYYFLSRPRRFGKSLLLSTIEAYALGKKDLFKGLALEKLEKACESGTVDYLYIGGKKVGTGKMKLESISETWDEIWNSGQLVKAKVSLTFSEY